LPNRETAHIFPFVYGWADSKAFGFGNETDRQGSNIQSLAFFSGAFGYSDGVRILDKYLIKEFGLPLLYCFDAFVLLWFVLDLLGRLGDFLEAHATAGQIVRYYLIAFPDVLVMIIPVSLLLGVLFCLSNLGRHNELTAIRASGVSVWRISVPMLVAGALASLVVFALTQTYTPRAKERTDSYLSTLRGKARHGARRSFFFTNATAHQTWYAREFMVGRKEMLGPEVTQYKPDGAPRLKVYAARAHWAADQWVFADAVVYDYAQSPPVVSRVAETNFPAFQERPQRLALEGRDPERMTTRELRRFVAQQKPKRATGKMGAYEVELLNRYAYPLIPLMVVWLAVPLGMRVSRSGPMLSIGTALILVGGYYFLSHFSAAAGGGGRIPAVVAAWLPNVVFAGVGTVLFWRAR
jgi:lipopolysaccharide export system permease protein